MRPSAPSQFTCDLSTTQAQCCVDLLFVCAHGLWCVQARVCECLRVKRLGIFYSNKGAQLLTRTDYVNDVLAAVSNPLGFEVCL